MKTTIAIIVLIGSALCTNLFAVSPPPDGGYTGNNTAEGTDALFSLTTGFNNTAVGFRSLYHNDSGNYNTAQGFAALFNNISGTQNTATGVNALFNNTTGSFNTADGTNALFRNTTGSNNTANGVQALFNNTTGHDNIATGFQALANNTTGTYNTANGVQALSSNTSGHNNTATGFCALCNSTTGNNNTAIGWAALHGGFMGFWRNTGDNNTASGVDALASNATGSNNTANGVDALENNTTGSNNTANGAGALGGHTDLTTVIFVTGSNNTANGVRALHENSAGNNNTANGASALSRNTTGSGNTAMGDHAGASLTTGSNNIDINNLGVAAESNTIRLGTNGIQSRAFIAGIRGVTTGSMNAIPVVIDGSGQLGTVSSSARFKRDVQQMDHASEALLALKPVSFHYKSDASNTPQFGLIAEEVADANPDLVVRDDAGEIYTVRYEAVNAMLLNEFLKDHRRVDEQASTIRKQQKMIAELESIMAEHNREFRSAIAELSGRVKEQEMKSQRITDREDRQHATEKIAFNR